MAQASLLGLYDPDRSKVVLKSGQQASWKEFVSVLSTKLKEWELSGGEGLRILTGSVNSPTLGAQIKKILERFPKAKWHRFDPVHIDEARRAQKAAFGSYADPIYDFSKAEVIVSLGSNFLTDLPGSLRYASQFGSRRKPHDKNPMSRLYTVEADPTLTGASADHVLHVKVSKMIAVAESLAQRVGVNNIQPASNVKLTSEEQHWLDVASKDLRRTAGKSLIVAGEMLPARIQALTIAMNDHLGNTNQTISWIDPIEEDVILHGVSMTELATDIRDRKVSALIIAGVNPGYSTPGDLPFDKLLSSVPLARIMGCMPMKPRRHRNGIFPPLIFLNIFPTAALRMEPRP